MAASRCSQLQIWRAVQLIRCLMDDAPNLLGQDKFGGVPRPAVAFSNHRESSRESGVLCSVEVKPTARRGVTQQNQKVPYILY